MKFLFLTVILLVTISHMTAHAQFTNQGRLVNMQFLREIMRDRLAEVQTTQKPIVIPPQKPSYPPWGGIYYVGEDMFDGWNKK